MRKMLKNKKGFKTMLTILSLLFIIIVFLAFMFLFKRERDRQESDLVETVASLDSEYALRAFLNSPSIIEEPSQAKLEVGSNVNNALLIALNCDNEDYIVELERSASIYFNKVYGQNWRLELFIIKAIPRGRSQNPSVSVSHKSFGDQSTSIQQILRTYPEYGELLREAGGPFNSRELNALYKLRIRGSKIGMQALPCAGEASAIKAVLLHDQDALQIGG
jgi:hypothetical protein